MVRRYFSQVLREAGFDIKKEYDKLFTIFNTEDSDGSILRDLCERFFLTLPFRGTCISFDEFNKTHGFFFERSASRTLYDFIKIPILRHIQMPNLISMSSL